MDLHFSGTYVIIDPMVWVAVAAGLVAAGVVLFVVSRSRKP